ncbi:MAG: hypothetical protein IK149_00380 [Oscillospiraceae bacterium]|nr:hypothetical protein [Oscillospiraceae bacterium]
MKKKLIALVLLVVAGLVVWKIYIAPKREGVAARYREHEVTWKQVEQLRSVLSLLGEKGEADDKTLVDRILLGYILADEAKALGVTVSESEAAQSLSRIPLPDGKTTLEDYLRTLGGSLQGSMDALKQQALSTLTLDRLREALAREYCEEHDILYDVNRLPEEVSRAVDEKIDSLIESHRDEIEYFF